MGSQWKVINKNYKNMDGYKRVAWPPVSEERIVREFTPQPQVPPVQPQPDAVQAPIYNNVQRVAPNVAVAPQQHYDNQHSQPQQYNPQPHQQQQQKQQPAQQYAQAHFNRYPSVEPTTADYSPQQQQYESEQTSSLGWKPIQPPVVKPQHQYQAQMAPLQQQYRAPTYDNYQVAQPQQQQQQQQQPPQYQPAYQPTAPQAAYQQPAQAQQQNYQPPPWVQPTAAAPAAVAPQYQPAYAQQHQPQQQQPNMHQQAYPVDTQTNQPIYDSYSQFQQQHQQPRAQSASLDQTDHQAARAQTLPQEYRGGSPGIITLRKEAPVNQRPSPVYNSQPAALSFQGGSNMRGDLKWPPPEYKEAAARENEERRKLALGPVCRPRKVNRDYKPFFEKNALNSYYPSYKVPPGTQHMFA